MRLNLKQDNIEVTILNLGYLATEYDPTSDAAAVVPEAQGASISLSDVLAAIRFVLQTSKASCVKQIDMPAMQDEHV